MKSGVRQQGFAIALLLWMIAGMALMVAAVIHFASGDIAAAELQLKEAAARAAGRGAALLVLRDHMLAETALDTAQEPHAEVVEPNSEEVSLGAKFVYGFGDGVTVTAVLKEARDLVSLNSASDDELNILLTVIGNADEKTQQQIADGIKGHREVFPGFRYPEELLAIEGASRDVYDRVRAFVHPYRTGQVNWPSGIRERAVGFGLLEPEADSGGDQSNESLNSGPGDMRSSGRITFESIAERKRLRSGSGDEMVRFVESTVDFGNHNQQMKARVWVSLASPNVILRTERMAASATRPNANE